MNHLGKDLKKVTVILKEKYYNGSESVRTFKCESGSGCAPDSTGNEIRGTFADGEKGRIESYEIEKTKELDSGDIWKR
jgi:hypothetical protein